MKITINKEYTTNAQLPTVKEKAHDFKAAFTDNDLLQMFTEATDHRIYGGEVIKCTVEAFAANNSNNATSYHVFLIVDALTDFHRIRFFLDETDEGYKVNTDEILYSHEIYRVA